MDMNLYAFSHHINSLKEYKHDSINVIFYKKLNDTEAIIDSIIPANNRMYMILEDKSIYLSIDYVSMLNHRCMQTLCDGIFLLIPNESFQYYQNNENFFVEDSTATICTYNNNQLYVPKFSVKIFLNK